MEEKLLLLLLSSVAGPVSSSLPNNLEDVERIPGKDEDNMVLLTLVLENHSPE